MTDVIDQLLGADAPAAVHLGGPRRQGRLEEREPALLVGDAYVRGFAGRLHLAGPDGEGTIWVEAGRPIDVSVGVGGPGARAAANAARVERWFFVLAAWRAGEYRFEPIAEGQAHRSLRLRHPALLMHEALTRAPVSDRLERWHGPDRNRFRLLEGAEPLLNEACEDPELRRALRLCDGGRSLRDIATAARLPEVRLLRAAYVLFCFGGLDPVPASEPATLHVAPAARERIEALSGLAAHGDYFTFLGVDRDASTGEIARAARALTRELAEDTLHPDVALATGSKRALIAQVITEAVRVLGDEALRVRYRAALGEP